MSDVSDKETYDERLIGVYLEMLEVFSCYFSFMEA